ncbi:MAG: hypothetical protein WCF46_13515, partial [Nitrososphaeraceae archaeon]
MAELQGQLENQRNRYYLRNPSTNSTPSEDPGPIQLTVWLLFYRSPIASYCANHTGRHTTNTTSNNNNPTSIIPIIPTQELPIEESLTHDGDYDKDGVAHSNDKYFDTTKLATNILIKLKCPVLVMGRWDSGTGVRFPSIKGNHIRIAKYV